MMPRKNSPIRPVSLRLDEIAEHQRTITFELHVREAHWWLTQGVTGEIPLGQAVMEANVTFAQAVRMLVEGPVDGWPPVDGEAAA